MTKQIELDLQSLLDTSIALALQAGEKIMEIYQRDFNVEHKEDESPLTEADVAAHAVVGPAPGSGLNIVFPSLGNTRARPGR